MPHFRLSLAVLALICPGCSWASGVSHIESLVKPIRVRVVFQENPEVAGGSAGSGVNHLEANYAKGVFNWGAGPDSGKVEVVVKNLRMSIDGIDFGEVEVGDLVVIDARTKERPVTINGVNRNPVVGDAQ